jgi:hypothetical protein
MRSLQQPDNQKGGFRNGRQKYKCHACGRQLVGGHRLDSSVLRQECVRGKQTLCQLARSYGCSERTIRRKLDHVTVETAVSRPRAVVLLMDTAYWGRGSGLMLFKDGITNENLLWCHVRSETNDLYRKGVVELMSRGFVISAIVCDGRRGLIQSFNDTPVKMCQFHQVAIVRKYLTKNPGLPAAIELNAITAMMRKTDRESFEGALVDWHAKWKEFINERSTSQETGKTFYTHKRLRSA